MSATPKQQKEQPTEPFISLRIIHIDHYTHNLHAYSSSLPFQAARLTSTSTSTTSPSTRLPVIRIFGTTPKSQQCCLHIHALRPYLDIPIPSSLLSPHAPPPQIYSFTQSLRATLEQCLRTAFNPSASTTHSINDNTNFEYIADIEPTLSTCIYGYKKSPTLFLKVSTYLPSTVSRIAKLLTHRALSAPFDTLTVPHEAHIPFILQFLTDYSLAGMDYIHLSSCKFRLPLPSSASSSSTKFSDSLVTNRPDLFWPFTVPRRSTSELEVDAFASDILNPTMGKKEGKGKSLGFVNRTLQVLWEEERLRTGVLPKRIVSKNRDVMAGAQLSPDDMKERLDLILKARNEIEHESEDNELLEGGMGIHSSVNEEEDELGLYGQDEDDGNNLSSSSLPLSDVLSYLDATIPLDDDDEDARQREHYEDGDDDCDDDCDDDEDDDEILSVERTWRDIADCTQVKLTPKRQLPTTPSKNKTESSSVLILPSPLLIPSPPRTPYTPRQPYTPRTPHTRTPSNTQSQSQTHSQSQQQHTQILKRVKKAPLSSSLIKNKDSLSIEWGTPFYSTQSDYVTYTQTSTNQDKRIRQSGAHGFPSFSLLFPCTSMKRIAKSTVMVVTPACKPPTMKRLRRMAEMRASSWEKFTSGGGGMAIDSAGRMVGVRDVGFGNELKANATPSFDTQGSRQGVMSITEADDIVIKWDGRRHWHRENSDEENDKKNGELEESLTMKRLSRTLRLNEDNENEDDNMSNEMCSPKYDETFQITINHFYTSSRLRSSSAQNKTPQKQKQSISATETATKLTTTLSLSESPHKHQNMSFMSIEILAQSFGDKFPDPSQNGLLAICTVHKTDDSITPPQSSQCTILAINPPTYLRAIYPSLQCFDSELGLLDGLAQHLRTLDPDVILGFEIQQSSIGFILERAQTLSHPFAQVASRWLYKTSFSSTMSSTGRTDGNTNESAAVAYYNRKGADVHMTGRHIISLWRIIRTEVKLPSYTRENVASDLFPPMTFATHTNKTLESWYTSKKQSHKSLNYVMKCSILNTAIVDKLHVLSRTGELARVYGIDFMSVLTRGSQFRVESMLRRVSKARGFSLLSAAKEEVFKQPAVEALPLVMEPYSGMYVDPVIVLDFQSLYPSVIIAHNLCFSTMLGNANRISKFGQPQRVGVVPDYEPKDISLENDEWIKDHVFVASNGEMFVDNSVRRGILPQMLDEILETRIMVKNAMKKSVLPGDEATKNLLNARQFGLKMIANVTYGYTSANFSGRMPCAGLADAIVQCGRDALERICDYVDNKLSEKASIVYGDTDSLFVKVKGGTRSEAFEIGNDIVEHASKIFPKPMQLKLEKVYQPCVLQTKKRYVGYCYESSNQSVPTFDAKGIETIRRDTCPLVQKQLERSIRLLFETKDMTIVKNDLKHLIHILQIPGRIPLSDFVFRREVRLGSYKEGHLPPAAIVASKRIERLGSRAAPRHGERVPFVVIYDKPGANLSECVVSPEEFLQQNDNVDDHGERRRLNFTYYIVKQILPSLDRVMSLVGARVFSWYTEFPRVQIVTSSFTSGRRTVKRKGGQSILTMFYAVTSCMICKRKCKSNSKGAVIAVCENCIKSEQSKQSARWILEGKKRDIERKGRHLKKWCEGCIGDSGADVIQCCNYTCSVHDQLRTLANHLHSIHDVLNDDGEDEVEDGVWGGGGGGR